MKIQLNPELKKQPREGGGFGKLHYPNHLLDMQFNILEELPDDSYGTMLKVNNSIYPIGLFLIKEDCIVIED